jgi:hypothetical protein
MSSLKVDHSDVSTTLKKSSSRSIRDEVTNFYEIERELTGTRFESMTKAII